MPLTRDEELLLVDWEIAKQDPWHFLTHFTHTFDAHDDTLDALSKPFPEKAVYRILCRAWVELDELFIEKSRQVMMTWIMTALYLHNAMFTPARMIFFQSKKQEDANEVLERARHIYTELVKMRVGGEGLPGLPKIKTTGEKVGTTSKLYFPDIKSTIWAIPQGPHIIRSYTASGILSDEMNHQPEFLDGYAAAAPTITGGGRFTGQGTPNGRAGGWSILHGINDMTGKPEGPHTMETKKMEKRLFNIPSTLSQEERRLWIEKAIVSMDDEKFNSIPLEVLIANTPGMEMWKTCHETTCLRVHYTADPDKDPITEKGKVWLPEAKRKMKSQAKWLREMEIRYDTFEGRPVISNWDQQRFVRNPIYLPEFPLRLTFDFGTIMNVVTFSQLQTHIDGHPNAKQLRYINEIVLTNSNTVDQAEATVRLLKKEYPEAWANNNIEAFCDPNADRREATTTDKSRNTSLKILKAYGIYPKNKKFGVPESTETLETVFSIELPNGEPAVILHPCCEYLIQVLGFGLHYPPEGKGRPGYYEKDGYFDHGGDCVRYDAANAFNEYDVTGKTPPMQEQIRYRRQRHTGRIIGREQVRTRTDRGVHRVRVQSS